MTSALESRTNRRTRWIAACALALGLGAGIVTGTAVASADDGALSNSDPGTSTGPLNDVTSVVGRTTGGLGSSLSNTSKVIHDTAQNAIRNLK
jgi:hypothetical protein